MKANRSFWPVLAMVMLILTAVGLVTARNFSTLRLNTNAPPAPAADTSDVKGLVIAIRPTGFIPAQIDLTDGTYLFMVQNRCGIRDLTFRFDRDTGERLTEVHDQKLQWKKEFALYPGTYILSVVNHPQWRSVINVKPK